MKIKKFSDFKNEAISGTFDISPMGPGMPRQELPSSKGVLSKKVHWMGDEQGIFSEDQWWEIYWNYLKNGGNPLPEGPSQQNIKKVMDYLRELSII